MATTVVHDDDDDDDAGDASVMPFTNPITWPSLSSRGRNKANNQKVINYSVVRTLIRNDILRRNDHHPRSNDSSSVGQEK